MVIPKHSEAELTSLLNLEQFPRSAHYDPEWVLENLMGPNVLWLTEALSQVLDLKRGIRVLDMGCGKAVSSIFLAKEFGVHGWATDLWVSASENWKRIQTAGLEDSVFPVHAEAHTLPFAENFFDALVSMDAYHYFGTDDLYLDYYSRFAKPNAHIGIVVPGLTHEFVEPPANLAPYWAPEYWTLHSPDWWRKHRENSATVHVEVCDMVPDGWKHWLKWLEICVDQGAPTDSKEADMLRADKGQNLGFTRVVARRREALPSRPVPPGDRP